MIPKRQLTGIILAGGESSRMGKNKALLPWEQNTLAGKLVEWMTPFCEEIIISGDPEKLAEIPGKKVPDIQPGMGPVGGIVSCLSVIQTAFALLAPCDMPFLNQEIFTFLLSSWKDSDQVLCFSGLGKDQPLLGIYRKADVQRITEMLVNGEKRVWKIVENLNGRFIPFPGSGKDSPSDIELNVNSPSQYFYAINKKTKMLRLLFFGSLTDKTGGKEITVSAVADLDLLKAELKSRFPGLDLAATIIAVNQNIVKSSVKLFPGDEIAFMPAFAGG